MSEASDRYPTVVAVLEDVTTPRLELRRLRPEDLEVLATVFAKPEVWQFPRGRGLTRAETEAFLDSRIEEWETCDFGLWAAIVRDGGRMIGYIGLSVPTFLPEILPAVEVGWRLDPEAWGLGYATEGATAALDQAFTTLGLSEVWSVIEAENIASIRVAERLGMRLEREIELPSNDWRRPLDAVLFLITHEEWGKGSPRTPQGTRVGDPK
jgi:RimJ/RimL family protein N-acetyltransferase